MKNKAAENSHFYDKFFVALFFILKSFCNLFRLYEYFIITLNVGKFSEEIFEWKIIRLRK